MVTNKVLIVDSNNRSYWVVRRELEMLGFEIFTVHFYYKDGRDLGPNELVFNSRCHTLDYYRKLLSQFIEDNGISSCYPVTDWSTTLMHELGLTIDCYGFSKEDYFRLSNKKSMSKLAKFCGLRVPKIIEDYEINGFGAILRPAYSVIRVGEALTKTKNYYVSNSSGLKKALNDLPIKSDYILQDRVDYEYIIGVDCLLINGELKATYGTKRLVEPFNGGASSLRGPYKLGKEFVHTIELFFGGITSSGICMLEFLVIDKEYYFIECNARPWGSMIVPHINGLHFVKALLSGETLGDTKSYDNALSIAKHLQVMKSYLRADPFRFFALGILLLTSLFKRNIRIDEIILDIPKKTVLLGASNISKRGSEAISWNDLPVVNILALNPDCDLFVCKGNINRSAAASEILREFTGKNVPSAGTIERIGRPLSKNMAKQFEARFGAYRNEHVSSNVFSHLHRELFVVFDKENLKSLLANGISTKSIMRFNYSEIEDPYVTNQYEKVFNQIYNTIVNAI